MTIIEAVFLGIIQGLTEFLPVSSSGHLVLFSQLLKVDNPTLVFEIVVHVGTLLAVFVAFRSDVLLLIKSFWKFVRHPAQAKELVRTDPGCNLLFNLVLATLPVVGLALIFREKIEQVFQSSLFVGFMLIITGTLLFLSERVRISQKDLAKLAASDAFLIGIGQAFAVLPGISRSGATIAVGRARGLDRHSSARFSFLLSIPAIIGALVFSLDDLVNSSSGLGGGPIIAGLIASAVTGYLAIHLLLNLIRRGKLVWFSYYTWFIGAIIVVLGII